MSNYLELIASGRTHHNNDGEDSEEQYSYRGTTDTTWDIQDLILKSRDSYRAIPADDDVKVGDMLYVVYAVYSSGDTFGHDNGAELEFISAHKTREIAEKNQSTINNTKKGDKLYIELDNGQKIQRYCSWDGYFESLDYASVECMEVK